MVSCRLCGLSLRLEVEQPELCSHLLSLWRSLFVIWPAQPSAPSIELRFTAQARLAPPSHQPISQSRRLGVWKTEAGYFLKCGMASVLHVDLLQNRVVGSLDAGFWEFAPSDQREFFLLCFLMILRAHGRFGLHANGLDNNGHAILIVGPSGCGKTTLSITLVAQGWQYVADDALVLRHTPQAVEALALRRGFSCTPNTAARFPALKTAVEEGLRLDDDKLLADLEQAFPGSFTPKCTPQLLLFPRLKAARRSQLMPLDETTTLTALMRQSPGILAHRPHATEQLKLLTTLVHQCRSYELLLGSDVFDEPDRLSQMIESAART